MQNSLACTKLFFLLLIPTVIVGLATRKWEQGKQTIEKSDKLPAMIKDKIDGALWLGIGTCVLGALATGSFAGINYTLYRYFY